MKRYHEWKEKPLKTITITCRDNEDSLEELINCIKSTGNIGHSFDIVVDPDNKDYRKKFNWDGDGSDNIKDVKVSQA